MPQLHGGCPIALRGEAAGDRFFKVLIADSEEGTSMGVGSICDPCRGPFDLGEAAAGRRGEGSVNPPGLAAAARVWAPAVSMDGLTGDRGR